MKVYEIRPIEGGRYELTGELGGVDRLEFDSIREAALHAQQCVGGCEATVRLYHPDGRLLKDRPIPLSEEHRRLF